MNKRNLKLINATFYKTGNNVPAGIGCLASLIKFFGGIVQLQELMKNSRAKERGVSLQGLMDAARSEGFVAEGYEGEISFLKEFYQPVILTVENDSGNENFVIMYKWTGDMFLIGDPLWGIIEYRENELDAAWKSRMFLLIRPGEEFKQLNKTQQHNSGWYGQFFKWFGRGSKLKQNDEIAFS